MPLSTIFQLYRGGHFIGGGNQEDQEKTTKLKMLLNSCSLALNISYDRGRRWP
jgi:hypothetical protein